MNDMTEAIKLTAACNGKDVALYDQALEGGTPAVTVRALADRLLIEVSIKVAREGEQSETLVQKIAADVKAFVDVRQKYLLYP